VITLQTIQDTLDKQVSPTDRDGLETKLVACIELLGVSAKLKSIKYDKLYSAKRRVMENNPYMKTALLRMTIEAETSHEQAEYMLAERLSVSLSKAIDGLKSILSITKEHDSTVWK
jgi:hypothetical protein